MKPTNRISELSITAEIDVEGHIVPDMFFMPAVLEHLHQTVEITINKEVRKNRRYRYFYGIICKTMADALKITPNEARDFLVQKFLSYDLEIGKDVWLVAQNTSSLTAEEFDNFLYKIEQYASNDLGILLINPASDDENNYLDVMLNNLNRSI
jgi:hypothetical protein